MADNNELQTNRLSGTTDDGVDLAARWPNFEAALRTIFGVPADTVMSEAMQIASGGNVVMTGTLTASGAPTADLHAATKTYVQDSSTEFGVERCRAYLTSNQSLGVVATYIPWDLSDINDSEMWNASDPTRITSQGGKDFLVGFSLSFDVSAGVTDAWFRITKNRLYAYRSIPVFESQAETGEVGVSGVCFAPNLVSGDYLELKFTPRSGELSDNNIIYASNATFWATVIRQNT